MNDASGGAATDAPVLTPSRAADACADCQMPAPPRDEATLLGWRVTRMFVWCGDCMRADAEYRGYLTAEERQLLLGSVSL